LATIQVYKNGSKAGVAGSNNLPEKRGEVTGWSVSAVRRHTAWLYSLNAENFDGYGYAVTLTLKDTPASAAEFHALRRAYLMRLERKGLIRCHWVIEWQRRGTPHLHLAVYFSREMQGHALEHVVISPWLVLAERFSANREAQHIDEIKAVTGWNKYLSKHASRGVKHYQRNGKPAGWVKTGRLWGYTGHWPSELPIKQQVTQEQFYRYRRLCRAWRIADARSEKNPETRASRLTHARQMLSCSDPRLSRVRGVSDWIPEQVAVSFLLLVCSD
jgi:hypothetical protein